LRQALSDSPVYWLEGNASPFGIFRQLWQHRHELRLLRLSGIGVNSAWVVEASIL
jgi:hypothetical protein